MLRHRGFSAWITSNGVVLPEYLVAVSEEDHRVSCWIPGQEGQTFQVYWQDHNGKVDSCGFIVLDGLVVPGRFLFGDGIASRGGIRSSVNTERPFVFQKVSDEPKGSYKGSSKEAGMIILKIKRINRTVARPANPVQSVPSVLGKRKVGDLCVGFGPDTKSFDQHNSTWDFEPYDEPKPGSKKAATYVSFVFRYRSPEFLLSQGISTETKKVAIAKKQLVRRVASLPVHIRDESDTSPEAEVSEPLRKRPRLDHPKTKTSTAARPLPTESRRSSSSSKRTVSWNATATTTNFGAYHGESQFFLPRNPSYSITTAHNPSNDTSAMPDTDTDKTK